MAVWSGGRVARWLRASRDHMLSGLQQLCAYRSPCLGLLPSGHLLPEVTSWAPVQGGSLRCGSDCAWPLEASAARGGPGGPVRTGSVRLGTRVGPRSLVASNPRLPGDATAAWGHKFCAHHPVLTVLPISLKTGTAGLAQPDSRAFQNLPRAEAWPEAGLVQTG